MRLGPSYSGTLSLGLILLSAAAAAAPLVSADALKAQDLFNAGDQAAAIAAMQAATQMPGADPVLHLVRGVMLANHRQYVDASSEFATAAAKLPGDPLPYLLAEASLTDKGDASGAAEVRKSADEILKNGRASEALSRSAVTLQSALNLYPRSAVLLNLFGDVRQMQGETAPATSLYREAARLAPWWIKPHFNLGMAYLATDPAEAARCFTRVLSLDPRNLRAYLWLGDAYAEQDRYGEALRAYRHAQASRQLAPQASVRIGSLYLKQRLPEKAKREFQEAAKAAPGDPAAQAGLAAANVQEGKYEEAARLYSGAAKLMPPTSAPRAKAALWSDMADAYTGAGDYARAVDLLKKIIELDPSFRNPYSTIASVYRRAGMTQRAIVEYRQKTEATNVNPADALILAELLRISNDKTGARDAYALALRHAKSEPFLSLAREGLESLPK